MFQGLLMALMVSWALPIQAMTLQLSHNEDEEIGDVVSNHKFLFAEGVIVPGDARTIKVLLENQERDGKRTVILLSSPGGVLEEVGNIKNSILKAAKSYFGKYKERLVLIVNLECSSACNILTAALTKEASDNQLEIHVANSSKFGFHSPVDVVKNTTKAIKNEKELKFKRQKMLNAYKANGVNSSWLNSQHAIFEKAEMTFIPASKLCSEKAGLIPADSCYDDSGNHDIFAEISANLENKKPLFKKP